MQTGRSRYHVTAFCTAGQQEGISAAWTTITNATLLSFSITYGDTPALADVLTVSKASAADPRIGPIFRVINVGENAWKTAICNETFEFIKGDRLVVFADNGNDLDVGFEAIFSEGG